MSPYYPTPKHRIEVCAHCLTGKSNPTNLVTPRCCDQPILYTYQLVDNQPAFIPPPDKPLKANSKQMSLLDQGAAQGKVERCAWCDERHAGGPENCDRTPAPGWTKPGGSL